MKTKISLSLVLLLLICIIPNPGSAAEFTEYIPVELRVEKGDHKLVKNTALLTPRHIEAMKELLKKYGEEYRVKNSKLYITVKLMNDLDLLQNYTAKATELAKEKQ